MPSIRVAHITTIDRSLRYLLLNQMQALRAAGYEVVGISAPGPDVHMLEVAGIRHIAAPLTRRVTPMTDLAALWRLAGILRRERFDVVHCHTPKAEFLGQVAARLAGVPVIVDTFRGIYYRPEMHPLWRHLFLAMARLAASCADVVLSQSRANLEMAVRERICPPHKIKYLGNGIDLERFDRRRLNPVAVAARRRELGLAEGAPVVGFVGRLVAEKGVPELLAAARQVRQAVPEAVFLLVGPLDPEKPDALGPGAARAAGVADACVFAGMRDDMPEMYGLMDLFVLPSHRESYPRSPMEAAAMGLPSITADVPGCREAVAHGRNGRLVPLGDAGALGATIVELLTNRDEARRMGREGRRLAVERFDERLVFERVQAEYARLLQRKGLLRPAAHGALSAAAGEGS